MCFRRLAVNNLYICNNNSHMWLDPFNMRYILRIAKKTRGCSVLVDMQDGNNCSFEYIQHTKIWLIHQTFNHGADYIIDFRRHVNKFCKKMDGIIKITIFEKEQLEHIF